MADLTLLEVIQERFGVAFDLASDSGQILNSVIPQPPLGPEELEGDGTLAPLTLIPTRGGVTVRAAHAADILTLSVPAGHVAFKVAPPGPEPLSVELTLLSIVVPLPFLKAAQQSDEGRLQAVPGTVPTLHLPALLLVVPSVGSPRLAPSEVGGNSLEVSMQPPFALIGLGLTLGVGFERGLLRLEGADAPEVLVPTLQVFVSPPGVPALALSGGAENLHIGLGINGGLSGVFSLTLEESAAAARPHFLHQLACRLRLLHSAVTLLEIKGQIDAQSAVEAKLGGALGDPGPGLVGFTLTLALEQEDCWRTTLSLQALAGGGFLWRTRQGNGGSPALRNALGAYAVFAPLLVPNLPGAGSSGYVDLTLSAGLASGIARAGTVKTEAVTVYGGELTVRQCSTPNPEGFLFFDVETELHMDIRLPGDVELLSTLRPIKVRHRAIGLRLDFGAEGQNPEVHPVFDPARGFSLDLSDPGMFRVPGPLGDIIQPEGARMARENPLTFEIDLAFKADLGIVTVKRATLRVPIDPAGTPTITALGVEINLPGALTGSGYLKMLPGGFAGSLDASIGPMGVRASAGLRIEHVDEPENGPSATGVKASFNLRLPVPIPLANSGLGIFGFLGLFAMHFERNQQADQTTLQWLRNLQGDATRDNGWKAAVDHWAFGLGLQLGTMEGGFLAHTKGAAIIELPGPRFLLVMNADILSPPPGLTGSEMGKFLAVIEISPDSLTIGILVEYEVKPLLQVRVPAEMFFDFNQVDRWFLDIGSIAPGKQLVSVKFLFNFRAEGYLMIHGDQIPLPQRTLPGFAVAAGIRAALIWGPEPIGLYLKIAAQVDVGISFKPLMVIGKMKISGELRLFVVGIEVSAAAEVQIFQNPDRFWIWAEVCGSVDFFFFAVEGCVTLELGSKPQDPPKLEPLLRGVSLHSRSPALLPGSGSDAPVDGSLGDAARMDGASPTGDVPVVPIDAIPVLQLEMRPFVDASVQVLGNRLESKLPPDGWARRSERTYRYSLKTVTLERLDSAGNPLHPALGDGETPVVWWDRHGKAPAGDDNEVQLALLSWTPDPTPAAAIRTKEMEERVIARWGDLCKPVASPANVLWTFRPAPIGPSTGGWTLRGHAWPDEGRTFRSAPAGDSLQVTEPWRSGRTFADGLVNAVPAAVIGNPFFADRVLAAPFVSAQLPPLIDDQRFQELFGAVRSGIPALVPLASSLKLGDGLRFVRLLLFMQTGMLESELLVVRGLDRDGNETDFELPISAATSRVFGSMNDLPETWQIPVRPWTPIVQEVLDAWFEVYSGWSREAPLVLIETGLPEGTWQVEIGLLDDRDFAHPHWGILIVEGSTEGEMLRFTFDDEIQRSKAKVVDGALHADQSRRALLKPSSLYEVAVTYDVQVSDVGQDDKPTEPIRPAEHGEQRFRFKTADRPPERLDPWVLATDPGPAEGFHFWGDPIRIVFSSNAVQKLFDTYGSAHELRAVVKAASGHDPQPAIGFDPSIVALSAAVLGAHDLAKVAMPPFESALEGVVADQGCVEIVHTDNRHRQIVLQMQLEPRTDYILDLKTKSDPDAMQHPRFRRGFTTSQHQNMQALAAAVTAQTRVHRWLANPASLLDFPLPPPGSNAVQVRAMEMETALRQAGWGDLSPIPVPRVTAIWQGGLDGGLPQPIALLLETPEPLWRTRDVPNDVLGNDGVERTALEPMAWLDVVESSSPAPSVTYFVYTLGGGRALALLRPGARGATVRLDLRRNHHPLFERDTNVESATLAEVDLAQAPWEVE